MPRAVLNLARKCSVAMVDRQLDDLRHREVGAERLEDAVGHRGRRGGHRLGVGERGPLGRR